MLVLYVHDRWSVLGGADWHLFSLLDSMPEGIEPAGLFGRSDGSVDNVGGVSGECLPGGIHFMKHLDKRAAFPNERKVGDSLRGWLRDTGPDLIHVHNILHPHLLNILHEYGPAVITIQDHRFFCPGQGKVKADGTLCRQPMGLGCAGCFDDEAYFLKTLALTRARLEAVKRFPAVIVLSRYMKQELVESGVRPERIHVIPPFVYGLDPHTGPAAFGRNILFAGRIVGAKGISDLLEAMELVDERAGLVVAGQGSLEDPARARVRKTGIADRVVFKGWTPHHEMADLYRAARVIVCPSRWQEPFGISGLEAMALGRPVVAYDVGGIREWLEDGKTGVMVPPGNTLALAAAINVLWRDPKMAAQLGARGRQAAARRFDRESLMQALLVLYKSVSPCPTF